LAKGLATAYYNLSTLLEAGVPLLRSLRTVEAGLRGPLQRAFGRLIEGVSNGNPLSDAVDTNPKLFARLDVMIIRAAEASGNLAESFGLLAKWHEFSQRIKRRILSGLALPFLLIHVTAIVAPLPAFVLGGCDVKSYILSALLIVSVFYIPAAIIIAIMRLTPETGIARRVLDHLSLWIPVLGRALYKLALSRYCRVFYMLCKAGVPITQCAEMATSGAGNAVVADLFRPAAASVESGNPFSEGLSSKLPPEFVEPWKIGEETGELDEIAKRLADTNAEAAEFWFNEFGRWFPRFVYVLVCGVMIYQIFKLLPAAMGGIGGF
jgi:type II secretory pathway component PulF